VNYKLRVFRLSVSYCMRNVNSLGFVAQQKCILGMQSLDVFKMFAHDNYKAETILVFLSIVRSNLMLYVLVCFG